MEGLRVPSRLPNNLTFGVFFPLEMSFFPAVRFGVIGEGIKAGRGAVNFCTALVNQ